MSFSTFLVLIGPSGAGKSSLGSELRKKFPHLKTSISATTRAPRPGEVDGREYYFLTREKFQEIKPKLLEWEEVHGQYYGTPLEPIAQARLEGKSLLFDIDIRGAATLKGRYPEETKVILILPPTFETLSDRITHRSQISKTELETRLNTARKEYEEMKRADFIDYTVINDDKESALSELISLTEQIFDERSKRV